MLNYPELLDPPLENGKNCLAFSTREELRSVIDHATTMPIAEIRRMRQEVGDYYQAFLHPDSRFLRILPHPNEIHRILVNNEEISLAKIDRTAEESKR